ncbi:MAG: ABC transporter ATP-binding protein [Calditrichaeota bacterium]|nr:ABC transporter ATP-binding protein [Calditrichota bacterium]
MSFYGVTKRYGKAIALDSLSLDVYPGELFGFLGRNGAGKTTAMKLATGLTRPSSGKVRIVGHDVQENPIPAKRLMGFVPDSPYIYESLTGREFMFYCAGLYRMNTYDTIRRVNHLFSRFDMEEWADKRAGEYSHGMKQRLVMASAFVHSPEVVFIDEPMVGLDPAGVKLVKDVLVEFCKGGGTVFMSTHTLSNAEELCDRIGIIKKGKLIAKGTIKEISKDNSSLEEAFLEMTKETTI